MESVAWLPIPIVNKLQAVCSQAAFFIFILRSSIPK